MAAQVPRTGAIPLFLARPGIRFQRGTCCSCGDPLSPGERYRCVPCGRGHGGALGWRPVTNAETGPPGCDMDPGIGFGHGPPRPGTDSGRSDPLVHSLARYVEALHRRYPDGPAQMRREDLDGRANITAMHPPKKDSAA
jgi:hypothetical protein